MMNGCAGVPEYVEPQGGAEGFFRCTPAPAFSPAAAPAPAAPSPLVPSGMGLTGALPARLQKPLLAFVAPLAFEAALAALAL